MIRRAEAKDIPGLLRLLSQIADLHRAGRPDMFKQESDIKKYDEAELAELLENENRPIFVAVGNADSYEKISSGPGAIPGTVMNHCNESVQGYCFCIVRKTTHPVLAEHLTLHIDDFCVDKSIRGKGIGKKLFTEVQNFAKECGAYNIDLNVWAFNNSAIKFYESLGFDVQRYTMEKKL